MKRLALSAVMVLVPLAVVALTVPMQDKAEFKPRPVPQTAEWQKLRSLVGEWEGVIEQDGKKVPSVVEVRMTGDGSAVMHLMGKDTPHEMVTMFHPDGERLLATHYCAVHNQPRMALVKAPAANQVAFSYVDGSNIAPGDAHMRKLVITFIDADHHDETWTFGANGVDQGSTTFHYARKKSK